MEGGLAKGEIEKTEWTEADFLMACFLDQQHHLGTY